MLYVFGLLPSGGIVYLCETRQRLPGLENVAGASTDVTAMSKRATFHF